LIVLIKNHLRAKAREKTSFLDLTVYHSQRHGLVLGLACSASKSSLDKLLGVGGSNPFQDLIEGSISVSAGVIVDMNGFTPTPLE
jgi:hypothetical protein